ncbi:hypothetical protein [Hymenobacter sp.]|uniref:hypothetical protein n=1 Tax=Hymenobacter sp. TaxID=1898978 RepID=UPI00286C60FC|nr:hypothetical protein [Hymenobacter sp.]
MDQVHLHLLINHLPIIGSLLGALVLTFGLWRKSEPTVVAAYGVLMLAALGAGVAQLTGEGAEEAVEHLPGVLESRIERHEEFSEFALVALLAMGALALGGLVLSARRSAHSPRMAALVLLAALVGFGLVGWTGYLGGQIRHTELNSGAANGGNEAAGAEEAGGDDD